MLKIQSVYGKTIEFKQCSIDADRTQVTVRDQDESFVRNMIFTPQEMKKLAEHFAPAVPEKSDKGVFFLLRQKKEKTKKVKVCFAESSMTREFTSRARAEAAAKRQNENYPEWNYFIVEKETV